MFNLKLYWTFFFLYPASSAQKQMLYEGISNAKSKKCTNYQCTLAQHQAEDIIQKTLNCCSFFCYFKGRAHINTQWLHVKNITEYSQYTSLKLKSSTAGMPGPEMEDTNLNYEFKNSNMPYRYFNHNAITMTGFAAHCVSLCQWVFVHCFVISERNTLATFVWPLIFKHILT